MTEKDTSDAMVDEALGEHRECMQVVSEVEDCLVRHLDRGGQWVDEVLAVLPRLAASLREHFEAEQEGALFRKVPLLQRHAVTGAIFLFLGARRILSYIDTSPRITGLDKAESAELLDAIYDHVAQPHFNYLHRWQAGDILIWDNRACAHRRESFDPAERRLLYGTPIVSSDVLWGGQPALAA